MPHMGDLVSEMLASSGVEVVFGKAVQRGTVTGLDTSGALLLEGEAGVQQVLAGDVDIERL